MSAVIGAAAAGQAVGAGAGAGQAIGAGGAPAAAPAPSLPPLREELNLLRGPRAADGSPTWVLHDPVAQRFFRIGWLEFEVLSRWRLGTPDAIVARVNDATPLAIEAANVEQVMRFLATHSLLQVRGQQAIEHLLERRARGRQGPLGWLLKNYLFVRIPVVRPDRFLEAAMPWVSWLWSPAFLAVLVLVTLTGLFLVQRQWDAFLATFPQAFTFDGMLIVGAALIVAKVLHEMGHGFMLKRFGCHVPSMGVALLVLWPVLYTDASDAWRLTSRRQRLTIGAAGIAVELALAAFAALAWSFMDDGPARTAVFLLATTTWIVTLFVNLNPFMRFDGYYLASDFFGIPNLQDRAFALGRWRLREWLFGFGDPAPEIFPKARERALILYAWGTWIYRFFLFLGIALLVYHLFFKALGIFLMVVEVAWFIARPIWNEFKAWGERRADIGLNRRSLRTLLLLAGGLALLFVPWQGKISAPGMLRAAQHVQLFVPQPGQIARLSAGPGALVKAGEPLVELRSPDLEHAISQGQRRIDALNWQLEFRGVSLALAERSQVLWRELETERTEQSGRLLERERLTVVSPIDGVFADVAPSLAAGEWLAKDERIGVVMVPDTARLEAWLAEADTDAVRIGDTARFYPDDVSQAPFDVIVESVETASTRQLPEPYLASTHGGPIAVRQTRQGELMPETPVYRIGLRPVDAREAPAQVVLGTVRIDGERRSLAARAFRAAMAVLVRESGF